MALQSKLYSKKPLFQQDKQRVNCKLHTLHLGEIINMTEAKDLHRKPLNWGFLLPKVFNRRESYKKVSLYILSCIRHNRLIPSNQAYFEIKMEITIKLEGLVFEVVLEELAKQKNVFGYDSISKSIAFALGSDAEEIMNKDSNHPQFHNFIKARNIVIRDIWGWQ